MILKLEQKYQNANTVNSLDTSLFTGFIPQLCLDFRVSVVTF